MEQITEEMPKMEKQELTGEKNTEEEIVVDLQTAMHIKVQEYEMKIADAESQVANLKKEKFNYIYNQNLQMIATAHKEQKIKQQIEEETKKRTLSETQPLS